MLKKYIILAVFLHVCFVYIFLSFFPPYTTMTHLTEADKEWAKPYSVDEFIVFKSNQNNYDTLIITQKEFKDNYFPLSSFTNPNGTESIAHILIEGRILHKHTYGDFIFSASRYDTIGPMTFFFRFDCRCYTSNDGKDKSVRTPLKSDVLLITNLNSETHLFPQRLSEKTTEIQINKNKGILYYEFENGERFTFYKRIPRNITWKERIEEFLLLY